MTTLIKNSILINLLFLSFISKAQININSEWTWIKGDSANNNYGYYGTPGIASDNNKPSARFNSVGWKYASNNLWLFGGFGVDVNNSADYLNDLWKFNTSLNQWIWMKGDSTPSNHGIYGSLGISAFTNKPGGRYYGNNWIDNVGDLWLFGGYGYPENGNTGNMSDLWKYDAAINEWTWMNGDKTTENSGVYGSKGISSANNKPPSRDAGVSWTDKSGNLWLFGGVDNGYASYLNDVWKYDISLNQWTWVNGNQTAGNYGIYGTKGVSSLINTPGARAASVSWTDTDGNFWLFGGTGFAQAGSLNELNDLWKYDPLLNTWTWVSGDANGNVSGVYGTKGVTAVSNKPGARVASSGSSDSLGNLFLFGGIGYGNSSEGELNDLWKYNITDNQWTWLKGDSTLNNNGIYGIKSTADIFNKPGSRFGNTAWAGSSGNLYLFGGTGYATNGVSDWLNDLWKISVNNTALPLTLLNFSATAIQKDVLLNWQTTQQINTAYFIIEHSINGINFSKLGLVSAGNNSSIISNYSFTHNQPFAGNNFYRLKIIDIDGRYNYSKTIEVSMNGIKKLQIFPNPAKDILFVQASGENENAIAQIFDMSGRKVKEQKIKLNGNVSFSISLKNISKGTYTLVLQKENTTEKQKFVKQ
jgi:N-acetylneuraminic acid mutarotase